MPILGVDATRGRFDHVCWGTIPSHPGAHFGRRCDLVRRGLALGRDVTVEREADGGDGADGAQVRALVACPVCGSSESLTLTLGADDETGEHHTELHRAQSRHIRALMRHPDVGLHAMVRECDCPQCEEARTDEGTDGGKERAK